MVSLEDAKKGVAFRVSPEEGGELAELSLEHEGRRVQVLHRPRPPAAGAWRGGAPWLFPAVGRSRAPGRPEGTWLFQGRERPMPMHGFAMGRKWGLVSEGPEGIRCRLASDPSSRRMYPFDFELEVLYEPVRRGVLARATIRAGGNEAPMPFAIGNHLSFRAGKDWRGCSLRSPARERQLLSPDGFLTGETSPAGLAGGVLLGSEAWLGNAVLGGFEAEECWAEFRSSEGWAVRVVQRAGWRSAQARFVLWMDGSREFLCAEPWLGAPDSLNEGLLLLAPREEYAWELEVSAREG